MEKNVHENEAAEFGDRDYDRLTGLMKQKAFAIEAEKFIRWNTEGHCCILAIDIANFHYFNKWYGRDRGDQLLVAISDYFKSLEQTGQMVCGYLGRDNFAVVLPHEEDLLSEMRIRFRKILENFDPGHYFQIVLGGHLIKKLDLPVMDLYDCALSALKQNIKKIDCEISWYDSRMDKEKEEELLLFPEIMRGLGKGEFVFYLQPKCLLDSGKIIGAEALVRWERPGHGVIAPGIFIPMLERNGYIAQLDRYIWREVCKYIRDWMDRGMKPLPISVNVSRVDIYSFDVAEYFYELIEQYHIPARYIEIEITESAYIDSVDLIRKTEEQLSEYGFKVLIDDFGSGFSTLNMLKDVRADVVKLDMKFLDLDTGNLDKGMDIIQSVLDMARKINLNVIAEGMETMEQVEHLSELGCKYGQGYYFYKPMPVQNFEELIRDTANVEYAEQDAAEMPFMRTLPDYFRKIIKVNLSTGEYRLLKEDREDRDDEPAEGSDFDAYVAKMVETSVYSEDEIRFLAFTNVGFLRKQFQSGKESLQCSYRRKKDNGYSWVQVDAVLSKEYTKENPVIALYLRNIPNKQAVYFSEPLHQTGQQEPEQEGFADENKLFGEALLHIAKEMPGGFFIYEAFGNEKILYANEEVLRIYNCSNMKEFQELTGNSFRGMVHPEDLERVEKMIAEQIAASEEKMDYVEYRIIQKGGTIQRMRDYGKWVHNETYGDLFYVFVSKDRVEAQ